MYDLQNLVDLDAVPSQVAEDTAHIAVATTNGVDFVGSVEFSAYCQCSNTCKNRAYMPTGWP